ncbi:MAG TPA: hypothetical protein VGQ41_07465 [Pyrinomonadaceae bacterium]|jgi:hypothetical protein|nr:hypothetical protein [Pyrinomonadaceae bacterium]
MIVSILLALLVTFSGTVATYLYDENASLGARLCAGAAIGLAALGLIGFVIASLIGLSGAAVLFSAAICSSPLALLADGAITRQLKRDLDAASIGARRLFTKPDVTSIGYFLFYVLVTIVLWKVFSRAVIEDGTGMSTGLLNNFGDLPFHLSVITSFAFGNNFPPEDPTYAGVRFTYPFISDFVSAMFVRCGADLRESMFIENFILGVSFVGLVHRWALVILRDKLAAIITPMLVLLNGGLGWTQLFTKAGTNEGGLWGVLMDLPPSFTVVPETTWRWGNAISALLVPQRGFLMGLPLATIAFTYWWIVTDKKRSAETPETGRKTRASEKQRNLSQQQEGTRETMATRGMIAAGVAAGLLPLVHAHSFIVVMGMAACLALIHRRWREWFVFFAVASAIAIPQLLWSTVHSAVDASSFFAWEVGWDHGKENPVVFWFLNTGFFIPLLLIAVLMRGEGYLVPKRLLLFYLPFTLCFIVPNLIKMAPWVWDNIKVLYYWWLASAPLVALLLARLWHQGRTRRMLAVVLFVCVTLAGALDVAGIALRSIKYQVFDAAGLRFAELVKAQTEPRSLIVHAPVHNTPVFLTGRRSLMGYPGHIWTHGLQFVQRESEIKRIYLGTPDAEQLIRNYGVQYLVVGPQERVVTPVNELFFTRFQKVGEVGEYTLYKVR